MSVVNVLVQAGKASPGPPLGPSLGPLGVNIKAVVEKINEQTMGFVGMQVPIKITVDDDKEVSIEVGTPPTTALIKKELGVELGSGKPNKELIGNITLKQAIKIANMKKDNSLAKTMKGAIKEVIGSCLTLGVTIEGLKAKEATMAINNGKFDSELIDTTL
jgi:large subunit ribosomal protein L11